MDKLGFYISKIEVTGNNTKPARLEFEPGFNVLTGLSDTGKSYVFGCINFMLGGGDSPKDIPESAGYTDVFLEIKSFEGNVYTLHRKLNGSDFILKDVELKYYPTKGKAVTLKSQHSAKSDNISSFLLELSGLKDKYVKKDKYNSKRELSYRDLAKLTLIDEERIITEKSPLYSGQYTEQTQEQSVLKLLLTGVDAKDLQQVEDAKVYTSKIKGKLELIDTLIKETTEKLEKIEKEFSEEKQSANKRRLDELTKIISDASVRLEELMREQKSAFDKIAELESKQILQDELINRFSLLKEHYLTDIKRLEFITDGENYFQQLNTIHCPLCGGDMDKTHYDCLIDETQKQSSVMDAIDIEIKKINLKLADLASTLEQLLAEKNQRGSNISELKAQRSAYSMRITKEIEPIRSSAKGELDKLLLEQSAVNDKAILKSSLVSYFAQKSNLEQELQKKPKVGEPAESIEYTKYAELCTHIEGYLKDWKYPNVSTVNFDSNYKLYDIVINAKNRKAHGKGIRAITYSAFILGLMDFCIKEGLPHPRHLIIDSPLTTYHGREQSNSNEDISKDMENAFFEDMATTATDRQVIIIDNKEPNKKLQSKINYIHFTGDKNTGRAGFFPI